MTWSDTTFHRFQNEAKYLKALADLGWAEPFAPPHEHVALDVIGKLKTAGFHVNATWKGMEMPEAFAAAAVSPAPETPDRKYAR